jgi:hypothetical protein
MRRSVLLTLVFLAGIGLTAGCGVLRGRGDDAIATDIKAKMFSDASLKSATLAVSVKDGVVTLYGNVPDDAARLAAYKLASATPGVSKVNDQMSVVAARAVPAPRAAPAAAKPSTPASAPRHPKRAKSSHAKPAPPVEVAEAAPPPPPAAQNIPAEEPAPKPVPLSPPPPPPPQPKTVTLQVGSVVTVRTIDSIDSKQNHTGQMFKASLDAPIVIDNEVVVPSGADAYLKLVNASSAGKMTGRSELTVELMSFVFQGKTYTVATSDVRQTGQSRGKRTGETVGGGAVLGAIIGAVAGGGKGAAIGAAAGAGAGAGVQVLTNGQQVRIPSESRLDFKIQQPLDITYLPGKSARARSSANPPPSN